MNDRSYRIDFDTFIQNRPNSICQRQIIRVHLSETKAESNNVFSETNTCVLSPCVL